MIRFWTGPPVEDFRPVPMWGLEQISLPQYDCRKLARGASLESFSEID
jgi:hypothetical protein